MAADQEYWDDVMARLSIAKATAAVNQVHKDALKIKLAKLKAQAEEQGLLTAGSEDETDAQAVARLTDSARGADDALAEADKVEADRVAAADGNDGKPTVGTVRAASAADGGDGEEAAEVIAGSKAEAAAAVAASIQKAGDGGGNGDDDDGSDDEILLDDDDEQDEHKLEEVAIENPDMLWWVRGRGLDLGGGRCGVGWVVCLFCFFFFFFFFHSFHFCDSQRRRIGTGRANPST